MSKYIYGVEKWHHNRQEWVPQRFDCNSLEEVGEVIDLLNKAMPNEEFRPAQYTVDEMYYIKHFG